MSKKPALKSWRDIPDAHHRSFPSRPNPESLHPNAATIERAIAGNEESRAVIDAYAFRFPVKIVEVLG